MQQQSTFTRKVQEFTQLIGEYGEENSLLFEPDKGRAEVIVDSAAGNKYFVPIESTSKGEAYIEVGGETFSLDRQGLLACMFWQADRHHARLQSRVNELKHVIA